MSNLIRWDPFREMWTLRRMMDRVFDDALSTSESDSEPAGWGLALDVFEDKDTYQIKASVPGIKPDELEITYTNDTLTINGETKSEEERENARFHLRERRYGKFARSISLPSQVDADKIEATYDAGVLTLRLPKSEEIKPKRIAIQSGESRGMLEGKFETSKNKN